MNWILLKLEPTLKQVEALIKECLLADNAVLKNMSEWTTNAAQTKVTWYISEE